MALQSRNLACIRSGRISLPFLRRHGLDIVPKIKNTPLWELTPAKRLRLLKSYPVSFRGHDLILGVISCAKSATCARHDRTFRQASLHSYSGCSCRDLCGVAPAHEISAAEPVDRSLAAHLYSFLRRSLPEPYGHHGPC